MLMYLDERADGTQVSLRPGDAFAIALPENRSTGYRWSFLSNGAPVLRVDADTFRPLSVLPGAPGQREWRMRAEAEGDAAVEIAYVRSWQAERPARRFTLRVRSRR